MIKNCNLKQLFFKMYSISLFRVNPPKQHLISLKCKKNIFIIKNFNERFEKNRTTSRGSEVLQKYIFLKNMRKKFKNKIYLLMYYAGKQI